MGRRSPREKSSGDSGLAPKESGGDGGQKTSPMVSHRKDGNWGVSDDVEDADDVDEDAEQDELLQWLSDRALRLAVRLAKVSTFRGPMAGSAGKVKACREVAGAVAGGE